jgi:hypothetical protein
MEDDRLDKFDIQMNNKGYYNKSARVSYDSGAVVFIAHIVFDGRDYDAVWNKEVFVDRAVLYGLKRKIVEVYVLYDIGD